MKNKNEKIDITKIKVSDLDAENMHEIEQLKDYFAGLTAEIVSGQGISYKMGTALFGKHVSLDQKKLNGKGYLGDYRNIKEIFSIELGDKLYKREIKNKKETISSGIEGFSVYINFKDRISMEEYIGVLKGMNKNYGDIAKVSNIELEFINIPKGRYKSNTMD